MRTRYFLGAVLLGVVSCFSARAQAPVVSSTPATAAPATTTTPPTNVMANPVPANATTPTSPLTADPLYSGGTSLPARNLDGGTQRADQPRAGRAAVPGSQDKRSLNRKRTGTTITQP